MIPGPLSRYALGSAERTADKLRALRLRLAATLWRASLIRLFGALHLMRPLLPMLCRAHAQVAAGEREDACGAGEEQRHEHRQGAEPQLPVGCADEVGLRRLPRLVGDPQVGAAARKLEEQDDADQLGPGGGEGEQGERLGPAAASSAGRCGGEASMPGSALRAVAMSRRDSG